MPPTSPPAAAAPTEAPGLVLAAAISDLSPLLARGEGTEADAATASARLTGALLGAVAEQLAGATCAEALGYPAPPSGVPPTALTDAAQEVASEVGAEVAMDADATLARAPLVEGTPEASAAAEAATLVAGPLGEAYAALLARDARWVGGRLDLVHPGGRRRAAGAWYTPSALVAAVLDLALDPVAAGEDAVGRPPEHPVVLDPACGSGRFLLAAARRLRAHHGDDAHPAALLAAGALRGWDRDPVAAALARTALWLEAGACGSPAAARAAVGARDALTAPPPPAWADAVVGNPPHGGRMRPDERRALAARYPPARRAGNTAAAFCAHAHELTRPGGRVGLVLPKAVTYSHTWAPLRAWLEPAVTDVVDVTTAWRGVRLEQVLLATRSGGRATGDVRLGRWGGPTRRVPAAVVRRVGTLPTGLDAEDERLLDHLERRTAVRLGEVVRTVRGGAAQPWARPRGDRPPDGAEEPVLGGRDLAPLRPAEASRVLDTSSCPPGRIRRAHPSQAAFQNIVAHRTRPADHACLIGTVLTEATPCLDTVNLLVPRVPGVPPWGLAGLLLSRLSSWFVHVACYNRAVRTMHFDNVVLTRVPLPDPALLSRLDPLARAAASTPDDPAAWEQLEDAVAAAWQLPDAARERLAHTHAPRA